MGGTQRTNVGLIVGLCLGIGIPVLTGIAFGVWCVSRRRRARREEMRRRRRFEMNIH
jgi:hypothetical protein